MDQSWGSEPGEAALKTLEAADIPRLPGERIQVHGRDALTAWERLRAEGRGWPLIVGGDDALARLAEQSAGFAGDPVPRRSSADIIAASARLRHPDDYIAFVRAEEARATESLARMPRDQRTYDVISREVDGSTNVSQIDPLDYVEQPPEIGEWPDTPFESGQLQAVLDIVGGGAARLRDRVTILRLPVVDGSEVPALLNWGGWNACPPPEYHVTALRSWRDRYGAELVALSFDVLELRVARRPADRDEALLLARELYAYCPDLVDQGSGTLAPLAASLMTSSWWSFWWD